MKTNTLFGIGVTAVAVALAVSLVAAQGSGPARRAGTDQQAGQQGRGGRGGGDRLGPQGPRGRFGGAFAGLNLTEDQRAKVAEVQRTAREQAAPIEEELRASERALHRELFADSRDAAKITELSAKTATLQRQLADLEIRTTSSVSDLLTAEQRATMRERDGRRGGPGRGPGRFHPGPHMR